MKILTVYELTVSFKVKYSEEYEEIMQKKFEQAALNEQAARSNVSKEINATKYQYGLGSKQWRVDFVSVKEIGITTV